MLRLIRRQPDVTVSVFLTLAAAYVSYIAAEEVDASGILAAAVAGRLLRLAPVRVLRRRHPPDRDAFWKIMVFGLEALLFILLGLQLDSVVNEVGDGSAGHAAGDRRAAGGAADRRAGRVRAAPARARPVAARAGRRRLVRDARRDLAGRRALDRRGRSTAAPRSIFLTFVVILITLVGQGLTLPPLIKALRLSAEREWSPEEAIARLEAAQSALDRLDELEEEKRIGDEPLRRLRDLYRARFRQCMAVIGGEKPPDALADQRMRFGEVRRDLIKAERAAVLGLRNEGKVSQESSALIERDLDLEEARLR